MRHVARPSSARAAISTHAASIVSTPGPERNSRCDSLQKKQTNQKTVSGNTKRLQCFSCGTVGDGGAGHFRHHGKNPSVLLSCLAPFSTVFMNPNSLVSDFPLTWLSSQQLLSKKKKSSRRFSITRCLPNAGFLVHRQRLLGSGRLYFALLDSISKKNTSYFFFKITL